MLGASRDYVIAFNTATEIVPKMFATKRNAETAKPLFSGEMVFITIVIAGPNQLSAHKYSRPRNVRETQMLFYSKVHSKMVGIPRSDENMQTVD